MEERTRELNKALGEIERLVSYDTLTGALNRRGMIKHLEAVLCPDQAVRGILYAGDVRYRFF